MFFIILFFIAIFIAYLIWNHERCPACKVRSVFKPTGITHPDMKQKEHQCSACGHTAWIAIREGGDGGGGSDAGGCGGCGGSGGGG
jgi:hypothetical protein